MLRLGRLRKGLPLPHRLPAGWALPGGQVLEADLHRETLPLRRGGGLFGGFPPVGSGDLRKLLDRFHLDRIDSGDLLLLGLLFLLYREGADEELLFALGLLLIL